MDENPYQSPQHVPDLPSRCPTLPDLVAVPLYMVYVATLVIGLLEIIGLWKPGAWFTTSLFASWAILSTFFILRTILRSIVRVIRWIAETLTSAAPAASRW